LIESIFVIRERNISTITVSDENLHNISYYNISKCK